MHASECLSNMMFTYFLMYCVMANFQSCRSIANRVIATLIFAENEKV